MGQILEFQDKTETGILYENSQSGYVNLKKKKYYLFIWPSQVSVAALRIFDLHWGIQDL